MPLRGSPLNGRAGNALHRHGIKVEQRIMKPGGSLFFFSHLDALYCETHPVLLNQSEGDVARCG